MNIRSKDKYDFSGDRIRVESIKDFMTHHLDGTDQERGALETVEKASEKTAEALGRLCELLAEKKVLTAREIAHIATGYADGFDDIDFEG